jgi:hypothetical protein
MLNTTKPQAVLAYSTTFDHRKIVGIGAKHHVAVMMEKPLAVSTQDARAIEKIASEAKIDELFYLRAVLLNGVKPDGLSSLETNVAVAVVMDAARKSAATRKTVKFGKR